MMIELELETEDSTITIDEAALASITDAEFRLFRISRPSTAATRVDNFKATDVARVSKIIHTDNQLHAEQFSKAAYTGWIQSSALVASSKIKKAWVNNQCSGNCQPLSRRGSRHSPRASYRTLATSAQ
jgi:hypothetical protein